MINSRSLNDLHPTVKLLCEQFITKCKEAGINIAITSTYRDFESQQVLYDQGRTKPGKIVTNAKPGYSYHNFRLAFDFVPTFDNKAVWDDNLLFFLCGDLGKKCGLIWGGDFKTFKDRPHFQYTQGLSLADFRAGKTIHAV